MELFHTVSVRAHTHTYKHTAVQGCKARFLWFLAFISTCGNHLCFLAQAKKPCLRKMSPGNSQIFMSLLIHWVLWEDGQAVYCLPLWKGFPQVKSSPVLKRCPICPFTQILQQNSTKYFGDSKLVQAGHRSLSTNQPLPCPGAFRNW